MVEEYLSNLPTAAAVFAVFALVIGIAGTKMAAVADRLADRTGIGEALIGAVLLGATTSISGSVSSVAAALDALPSLAVNIALGGIAVQTVFLVVADLTYRKANLEHAAPSVENLMQGALLILLLAIPLAAALGPDISLWGLHPASPVLLALYVFGQYLARQSRTEPTWQAVDTKRTHLDEPDEPVGGSGTIAKLSAAFLALAVTLGISGFMLEKSGVAISRMSGLSVFVLGGLFTAIATSLPELVTTLAAVRRGALTLAVGGIIGGNTFDVLFIAFSDIAYREGSIYHAISRGDEFFIAVTIALTTFLLLGLLRRQRRGPANIGFEGVAILLVYFGSVLALGRI